MELEFHMYRKTWEVMENRKKILPRKRKNNTKRNYVNLKAPLYSAYSPARDYILLLLT